MNKISVMLLLSCLSIQTMYGMDWSKLFKQTNIIDPKCLTVEQQKALATEYQQYRSRKLTHAKNDAVSRGVPAGVLGSMAYLRSKTLLNQAEKAVVANANKSSSLAGAVVFGAFDFVTSGKTWKGLGCFGVAGIASTYAAYKLGKLGISTYQAQPNYTQNLYGINRALKNEMGKPRVKKSKDQSWEITTTSNRTETFDLKNPAVMQEILEGNKKCAQVKVPKEHYKQS